MDKRIVVAAGAGDFGQVGAIIADSAERAVAEQQEQIATLPVAWPASNDLGVYFMHYGVGIPLGGMRPVRVCPTLLWITPHLRFVHVMFEVARESVDLAPRGSAWLTQFADPPGGASGSLSSANQQRVDFGLWSDLADAPSHTGIFRLSARVTAPGEGFFSVGLQAVADGVRVRRIVATQSDSPE